MPLLEGHFDPKSMNAAVLQVILRDAMMRAIELGSLRPIDIAQQLLDELAAKKIIW